MKKQILTLLLGALVALPVLATDFKYAYEGQELSYTVLDETARTCRVKAGEYRGGGQIISGNSVAGNLIIPQAAKMGKNEYSVVSIGQYAFAECELTSVSIPNSVTSIGEYAFYACRELASVTIPNSVTSIGKSAFSSCESLTSVTIPNSVTSIGEGAFQGCKALTSVILPDAITTIPGSLFYGCKWLRHIELPAAVKRIEYYAFKDCEKLRSINLPEGIVFIGNEAFWNTGLTSITLPSSLESAGNYIFTDSPLKEVKMPDTFFTTLESKKNVFGGTPYYEEIKAVEVARREAATADRELKSLIGTWTLSVNDRTVAVYTFNKDNTYTAKYTSYLHAPTGCYWTFTESGTWSLDKGLVTPTPKTFSRPTVRVSPSANWQQKKYPSVIAAMTPGEYSKFLRDDVSASDGHVFKMKSDSQMDVKNSRLTSDYDNTWGILVKKSGPAASSGKKSATKKRSGSRRR